MSIILQNLAKRYGTHAVVDRVSLEIEDGELFVLLGASGSGKSTILRMIAGLVTAEEGHILLHGRDVTGLPPQQRNIGMVFQNYSLFRHMTAAENIEFPLSIRKVPKAKRHAKRDELLDLIGMAGLGGRYPRQLSGGQQQRVAVARALAAEPSVLLLDEPFGALDAKIRAQLRQTLKAIQRRLRVTTILVTHDQEEAFELADRIGVIERGHLLEVGTPLELYRRPKNEFVARFLGTANMLAGQSQESQVQLGSLALPTPPAAAPQVQGQTAVLFRPEDLLLANERWEIDGPVLGQGIVEEILFLGTLQRIRVRLTPMPGTWPLSSDYGETGVPLQVALLSGNDSQADFQIGQTVWVGIKAFHLLPQGAPHFLVCIENAPEVNDPLPLGLSLAQATGGHITLLAVADNEETAQQLLAVAIAQYGPQFPALKTKTRYGTPTTEILRELAGTNYDLILVGGIPNSPGAPRIFGTAEQLASQTPRPLLTVKGNRQAIRRVLLCTAGGEPGKFDVTFGSGLAQPTGAAATLLYVADTQPPENTVPMLATGSLGVALPRTKPWIEQHLERGVRTLLNKGIRADAKVRYGNVLDEILTEAAAGDYDLIVVGSHLSSAPLRFLERDLTTDAVALADRPVLVVPGTFDRS
jgi:sulfate transport system ATP-binding protein